MTKVKKYDDFTILVQGKLSQDSIDHFKKYIDSFPIVISTWVDNEVDLKDFFNKNTVIEAHYPETPGHQNFFYQLHSTLNGLNYVKTKYVIKVRGDEYYNIINLVDKIHTLKNYVHTTPVFFRPFKIYPYHISDHLIFGKTEHIYKMFSNALKIYQSNPVNENSCETGLTKAFLVYKGFDDFDNLYAGKKKMYELFSIIPLDILEPYKIKANCYNRVWFSGSSKFIPSDNASIDNLENL